MKYALIVLLVIIFVYSLLWLTSLRFYPTEFGISFNPNHARSLDLDWRATYLAMRDELKPKYIRIAAMWSGVEPEPERFDFADVDWLMDEAGKFGAKVTLVVGQKAPRWPECHVPAWVNEAMSAEEYVHHLRRYLTESVNRYKNHPALELWQVENEPFIRFRFGDCERYRSELVRDEIALVRQLDPAHKIMITDSGELSTWRRAIRAGDFFGTTVYRVVRTPRGRVVTYDWLPPAFYRWKARLLGRARDTVFISELQAEPWFSGSGALETPLSLQAETMNPERLKDNLDYARRIGAPRAYLWGVEWWYWMREKNGEDGYWEGVREEMGKPVLSQVEG